MNDGHNQTEAMRQAAARYLAGGVLHHLTAIRGIPLPIMVRGKGSHLWDSDGKEYIDYYLGSASIVLGHAHPAVVDAVRRQEERGSNFFEITPATLELAQLVVESVPCAEVLKYAPTGTEAVATSLRIARAITGKNKILKFEGANHGSNDMQFWGYRHREPLDYPRAEPDSIGVPKEIGKYVLVAPYNDLAATEALIRANKDDLAAVIAEPLLGNVRPKPGFLEGVRRITAERSIPLVFDEIVSGFRLALGGAQEFYGVVPDMTALGKSLGGGYPIGALVGSRKYLDILSPAEVAAGRYVMQVGTFSGNPISCTAGAATIKALRAPGTYERLHAIGRTLGDGLREIAGRLGIPMFVVNVGPMVDMWFTDREIDSYPATWIADTATMRRFKLGLIERGIWSPPGLKMFLCLSHSDEDIARTLEAAEASMRALKPGRLK
jgi:glutamate-1-semialdehyde 2,1-aminomutase